jgi:large subunit ribosomal protein L5
VKNACWGCSYFTWRTNGLDRLIHLALPRVRDFQGISSKVLIKNGNYSLGLEEQLMFPEIEYDKIDQVRGMDISIVTTAQKQEEGLALYKNLGYL